MLRESVPCAREVSSLDRARQAEPLEAIAELCAPVHAQIRDAVRGQRLRGPCFDALHAIQDRLQTRAPFQVISGYRSPRTNAMLHARSKGVASNSQHTLGKAVDVRMEGVALRNLQRAALDVKAGGVGFYPVSDFVHVDVGRVRQWSGA